MEPNDTAAHRTMAIPISRILMSGGSGFIGRALSFALRSQGMSVDMLTRGSGAADAIHWDPEARDLSPDRVSGYDAVIHLAGEPVGNGRWSKGKKRKIYDSRIHGTTILAKALTQADRPPRVFLCASGVNYYGSSRQDQDEDAPAGTGFLSKVCVGWEQSASLLNGIARVIPLRIGVVLSEKGGTLAKMLPVFRRGLGGYVGSGEAYLSWITLDDVVRAVLHILQTEHLRGPVNLASPEPVTGRLFAESLGRALGRPSRLHVPAAFLRLVLGEFAEETILSSVRAVPSKLVADGFVFHDSNIQKALNSCLGTTAQTGS